MTYRYYPTKESTCDGLLLFLNGWGMGEAAVRNLAIPKGFDFLIGYDYRSFDTVLPVDLAKYESVWLAAWSMGVWAAERLAQSKALKRIDRAIAMAGSPFIRDDFFGIPERIFDQTLAQLNDNSRQIFNRRMCGGKSLKHLFEEFSKRSTEELEMELRHVQGEEILRQGDHSKACILWEKALVAKKDRIIPFHNLISFWQEKGVRVALLPRSDHYFLDDFGSWQELFDL